MLLDNVNVRRQRRLLVPQIPQNVIIRHGDSCL
jgi:hypothetical protein